MSEPGADLTRDLDSMAERLAAEDPRCDCGHLKSEHNVTYDWTSAVFCGGAILAVDQHNPDDRRQRWSVCGCNNFREADEWRLREWGDIE